MFTFKGEAGHSDITEVTLAVELANHCRAGHTEKCCFSKAVFRSLVWCWPWNQMFQKDIEGKF